MQLIYYNQMVIFLIGIYVNHTLALFHFNPILEKPIRDKVMLRRFVIDFCESDMVKRFWESGIGNQSQRKPSTRSPTVDSCVCCFVFCILFFFCNILFHKQIVVIVVVTIAVTIVVTIVIKIKKNNIAKKKIQNKISLLPSMK